MNKKVLGYLMQLPLVIIFIGAFYYSPPAFGMTILAIICALILTALAITGIDLITDDTEESK